MKTTWVRIWTLFVALASIIGPAYGANITVDDADPKIIYSSGWSIGNTCTACVAQPDKALTYGATWHDTTRDRNTTVKSVEYSFEGTAIYVYGIIINIVRTDSVFTTNNNLSLWIDGHLASVYQHQPLNTNSYEYDVPVFALSGLSPSTHLARVDLEESSVFLFDYLIYSTPEATSTSSPVASPNTRSVSSATSRSTSNGANSGNDAGVSSASNETSSSSPNVAAIVGAVFGVAAFLILLGIFLFLLKKRKKDGRQMTGQSPQTAYPQSLYAPTFYEAGAPTGYTQETLPMMNNPNNQIASPPYSYGQPSSYAYRSEKDRRGFGAGTNFQPTGHPQTAFIDSFESPQYPTPPPSEQAMTIQTTSSQAQNNLQRDTMGRPLPTWAVGLPNDGRTTYMAPMAESSTVPRTEENGPTLANLNRHSSFRNLLPALLSPRPEDNMSNSDYSTSSSHPERQTQ
ncbi:hypothetical protein FRC15_005359, partial [Serendipita sp. 397]